MTTPISDLDNLPELPELSENLNYQNYIRNNYEPPVNSGMANNYHEQKFPPKEIYENDYYDEIPKQTTEQNIRLHCIDVADHIKNCPICSKFYKKDNTLCIAIIIILVIICILLLKRVLDI